MKKLFAALGVSALLMAGVGASVATAKDGPVVGGTKGCPGSHNGTTSGKKGQLPSECSEQ